MLDEGAPLLSDIRAGRMTLLSPDDVMEEMRLFLGHVDAEGNGVSFQPRLQLPVPAGHPQPGYPAMLARVEEAEKNRIYKSERYRAL